MNSYWACCSTTRYKDYAALFYKKILGLGGGAFVYIGGYFCYIYRIYGLSGST